MVYEICYVLRRRDYSETSFLLELLTHDSQYVHAIFRGGKRKGGVAIDLFTRYEMSWRPRVGLVTLRGCEVKEAFSLAGESLYAGLYLNELVRRGMRENQLSHGMHEAYASAVSELALQKHDLESSLRRFERRYLKALGFEVVFSSEQRTGNPILAESNYRFDPMAGFRTVRNETRSGVFAGRDLLEIAEDCYEREETRLAAKLILRDALQYHLGENALKARTLLMAKHYREAARQSN